MTGDVAANTTRAVELVFRICDIACDKGGADKLIDQKLERHRVIAAVRRHDGKTDLVPQFENVIAAVQRRDTAVIFNWFVDEMKYQGVKNNVAESYVAKHGDVQWSDIAKALAAKPSCPKLASFQEFKDCRYKKGPPRSCANPAHLAGCSLPSHDLRRGTLNQNAYSLFLFMRDVAGGDIVGWIDNQLAGADRVPLPERPAWLRDKLISPLERIAGAGKKVLSMALSDLLLAADAERRVWVEAGAVMIAIDSLVHNFLHRTGILRDFAAEHAYGNGCYDANGCRYVIERISSEIDARRFDPKFLKYFPRFVEFAIWCFCAEGEINRCNSKKIGKDKRCNQNDCPVYEICGRVALNSDTASSKTIDINPTKLADKSAVKRSSTARAGVMIDHISLGVADFARARRFYDAVLAPLGYRFLRGSETTAGYGDDDAAFWIVKAPHPVMPDPDSGLHVCFRAPSRAAVDAFYRAALAAGGRDNGAPGERDYEPGYYAAFVIDPDGYRIEAYCGETG